VTGYITPWCFKDDILQTGVADDKLHNCFVDYRLHATEKGYILQDYKVQTGAKRTSSSTDFFCRLQITF